MVTRDSECLSCGCSEAAAICEKRLPSSRLALQRCAACGLVYQRGWGEQFDAGLYEYYRVRADWPLERVYRPLNSRRIASLLDHLGALVPGRRLLDVGCGAGQLVSVATSLGWDARGIDLAPPAVALARKFGARCDVLDFFAPELSTARFDVIVMSEFIEHVPAPARFLRRASELLVHGGIVYVTTPNFSSLTRYLVGVDDWQVVHPQHLSYFTPRSLRRLVNEHTDLAVLSLESRNISPEVLALLRKSLRGSRRAERTEYRQPSSQDRASTSTTPTIELRMRIERSRMLRAAKAAVNKTLDIAGVGEGLFAILQKPLHERRTSAPAE